MKIHVFLLTWLVLACCDGVSTTLSRARREAAGALSIVTNHAQPIHADVKPEHQAAGITEQVTAPQDAVYEVKSLRKSFLQTSRIELARSICRVVTLAVLLATAAVEFYPLLCNLYQTVYSFIYF